ncbi:MAG: glycoside hydrolase family 3 C-terminal domain-containing protein [Clostridia bacterium]|nr:glycoside hydrolase family 3 C-terminal domain-containing protein [Clostridia bacterium]MBQ3485863.1 glycoside hydrolase family 3 C-terminal domain-containing protein [Clostridia bacterium]
MKNLFKKVISLMVCAAMLLTICPALAEEAPVQPELVARVKSIIEVDGYQFKDLNDNGELDVYEDWRKTPEERADDLLSQMDATQKASQMVHLTLVSKKDSWFTDNNVGFALVYEYVFDSAYDAAVRTNEIQELSESSALGIPVIFSMDTEAGAAFVKDGTFLPDEINQGAVNDPELVKQLNIVLREELLAIGVRMALSPDADLITDPRWGRNQECYSEDTEVVKTLIVAAIEGLQDGNALTEGSVIATVKHFPGSGAQTDGVDGTPLTIQEDSLELHLAGFKAAIAAGVAAVMPYGYSTVPYLGGDAVENYADQSAVVMTDLLRGELGFDGLIQTDWGLNFAGAANAGADILGGAGVRSTRSVVDDVPEDRLTDACRRILIAKFQLGIFENPYVDENAAASILGSAEHRAIAQNAAARSFTMVKYENAQELGEQVIIAGELADNARALNSGWTAKDPIDIGGTSILKAFQNRLGEENVTYYADAASVPADLSGKTVIVVVGEKSGTHEPAWGTANLEFPEDQRALLAALDAAGANVVSVVLMNRAYVLTPVVEMSDSVLLAYRPGVTCGADAVVAALYGETPITGRLPFQIPATMEQVLAQREDLPKDIIDPLYEYGFGIDVAAFGQ